MHEARLHVDAEQHAEPDQVDAERLRRGRQQRHDDEGELEEIEEEGEHEDEDVDDDQEADLAAGKADQQVLDPAMPVDAVESQREDARADQDEEHEGGELRGRLQRLAQRVQASRRLAAASTSAPTAPMAPPSVGVAMPRKIVPSTRKIRVSGGTRTMITCSARRDSSPRPSARFSERHDVGEDDADGRRPDARIAHALG